MGAFLVDALENDSIQGLKEYTADHLLGFLTRQGDKDLMTNLVKRLGGILDARSNSESKTSSKPF